MAAKAGGFATPVIKKERDTRKPAPPFFNANPTNSRKRSRGDFEDDDEVAEVAPRLKKPYVVIDLTD